MVKAALALICGFTLTLVVFGGGAAVAAWFLAVEPVQQGGPSFDPAEVWTREPTKVTPESQAHLERVPQRPPLSASNVSETADVQSGAEPEQLSSDPMQTGSVRPAGDEGSTAPDAVDEMTTQHNEWCSRRYRSFNPEDNTYRPFSGGQRTCVSPYGSFPPTAEADVGQAGPIMADLGFGSQEQTLQVGSDHVAYCFSRYRSYRPEDNTYQPYGGGPRRQCD